MVQFQKEKNYQMERTKASNEDELASLRRNFEKKIEDMRCQIKSRELHGQELADKYSFFENEAHDYRDVLEKLELELVSCRDTNSSLTENVMRE